MERTLKIKSELVKWCDQQVAEGKTISMHWEGGNDSGWCWFEIDGEQVRDHLEEDEIGQLLDMMYNTLDYGSWAGEFSASGKAVYDAEHKAFVGIDNYSEDDNEQYECNLEIRVPKTLWFDQLEVSIEDEAAVVSAAFHVRNGFISEEHEQWLSEFEELFSDQIDKVIEAFKNNVTETEYRSMWEHWTLNKSDFHEEGEFLVHKINTLSIGTYSTDEKEIYLELEEENE